MRSSLTLAVLENSPSVHSITEVTDRFISFTNWGGVEFLVTESLTWAIRGGAILYRGVSAVEFLDLQFPTYIPSDIR